MNFYQFFLLEIVFHSDSRYLLLWFVVGDLLLHCTTFAMYVVDNLSLTQRLKVDRRLQVHNGCVSRSLVMFLLITA